MDPVDGEDSKFILHSNAMMLDDVDEKIHMRFASFTIYVLPEEKGVSFTLFC